MGHHHHHHHDDHHQHDLGPGHNHPVDHLHSHVHGTSDRERLEELQILAANFIDGFRKAEDKTSFMRLSGIPFQKKGTDGLTLNLVDTTIVTNWQVGTASPAFASRELVYMPFPGEMVSQRENMTFTYVSLTERVDLDLVALLTERFQK